MGLYPCVDSSEWVTKLLRLGVKDIQLRIKARTIRRLPALGPCKSKKPGGH